VLPTFVDRRRATADAVTLLQEQFGDLLLAGGIPRSARFDASALSGVPIALAAPRSAPAIAYAAAAAALAAALANAPKRAKATRRPAVKRFVRADMRDALREVRRPAADAG
jgi:cellulose biosynthesis protein BcsQ